MREMSGVGGLDGGEEGEKGGFFWFISLFLFPKERGEDSEGERAE